MDRRPFANQNKVWVIGPSLFSSLSESETQQAKGFQTLALEHRQEIESDLGAGFEFTTEPNVQGPRWLIGPMACNPTIAKIKKSLPEGPEIFLDRKAQLLICDGRTPEEVSESFSYLRSLSRFEGGLWEIQDCPDISAVVECVYQEVKVTSPAFHLKNLSWDAISQKHRALVANATDPIAALQKWLAELQDAHTWVKPVSGYGGFPYDLRVQGDQIFFYRLSESSRAGALGVQPGFELVVDDLQEWRERTAASPHSKEFVIGARMLATKLGTQRKFVAKTPQGQIIEWQEEPMQDRWQPLVQWRKLESGNGYLRIAAWLLGKNLEEQVDEAFEALKDSSVLIVDLRANPGGNLLLAHQFRNRFLREAGVIGSVQSTGFDGGLGPKTPILGNLASEKQRWQKPVIFLTDPLTYSASEDVMLGLQGLRHVKVLGQPSGGGSGRPRILRLLKGFCLSVSTALTFDNAGNCIEGRGIPVDQVFPFSYNPQDLIDTADRFHFPV